MNGSDTATRMTRTGTECLVCAIRTLAGKGVAVGATTASRFVTSPPHAESGLAQLASHRLHRGGGYMNPRDAVILFVFASIALVAGAMTSTHIDRAARIAGITTNVEAEKTIVGWVHLDPETAQLVYVKNVGRYLSRP